LADRAELTPDLLPNEILRANEPEPAEKSHVPLIKENSSPQPTTIYHSQPSATRLSPDNAIDLKSVEQEHIMRVLNMVNGNKSEAAKRLDIGLATLYRKLKEYNLN